MIAAALVHFHGIQNMALYRLTLEGACHPPDLGDELVVTSGQDPGSLASLQSSSDLNQSVSV